MKQHPLVATLTNQILTRLADALNQQAPDGLFEKLLKQDRFNYLIHLMIQSFFLMVKLEPTTAKNEELAKSLVFKSAIKAIRLLSNKFWKVPSTFTDFWNQLQQIHKIEDWNPIELKFDHQVNFDQNIEKTVIKFGEILALGFGKYAQKTAKTDGEIKYFQQLGFNVGQFLFIRYLEKHIPKHKAKLHSPKNASVWKLKEKLFFQKLVFAKQYITILRKLFKHNFNFFIQNLNVIAE